MGSLPSVAGSGIMRAHQVPGKLPSMRSTAFAAVLMILTAPAMAGTGKSAATPAHSAANAEAPHAAASPTRAEDEALYQMGLAARKGRGVKADSRAALEWFCLAGAAGSALGALEAAKAYEGGHGTRADLDVAGQWWYRAAVLGNAQAKARWLELFLGGRLHSIGGVQGIGWVAARAEAGDVDAALALAGAYEVGRGIAPDLALAERWYRHAALLHGSVEARFRLGRMLLGLPAQWRVFEDEAWTAKAAERDRKPLGPVWLPSRPDVDEEKRSHLRPGIWAGEQWLSLAARQGHAEAQYWLGAKLVEGSELPLDLQAGIGWLEAAAAQGHPQASMQLADLAVKGQGLFAKDPIRAWVLYDLAAAHGQPAAAEARDALGRTLGGKSLSRARQMAQDVRDITGL